MFSILLCIDLFSSTSVLVSSWSSQVFLQPCIPHVSISMQLFCKWFWYKHLLQILIALGHCWCPLKTMSGNVACPWVDSAPFLCSTLLVTPYKFVWCLEPCYLKLSLCQTIFSVSSVVFRAVFYPLSWTFSFHSFEWWKNTFENFDRIFIFSYFNTTTCRSSKRQSSMKWNAKKQPSVLTFFEIIFFSIYMCYT